MVFWAHFRKNPRLLLAASVLPASARYLYDQFDCVGQSKWDQNWDKREPKSIMKWEEKEWEEKESIHTLSDYTDKLDTLKGKRKRNLILVRHGQYDSHGKRDEDRILTELGRKQALETGKRLQTLNSKYDLIISSTMQRAMETTNFILDSVRVRHMHDSFLEEGFPYMPEPSSPRFAHRQAECLRSGSRIEAAFRRHFWRAPPEQTEDSYEILVCHANVIRYFVCRALQFPAEGWLRISLPHASITWITIYPDGQVILRCLGDSGHLPPEMVTYKTT